MNKTPNAMDRLNAIEQKVEATEAEFPRLVSNINGAFTQINQNLDGLTEIVNAVVAILGEDAVSKALATHREQKELAKVEATKAAISQLRENGQLVEALVVSEKSMIVGVEKSKDGEVMAPGYVQLQFPQFKPEFQAKLLGQSVGFVLETAEGRSFTVNEIYDFVQAEVEETPDATEAEINAALDGTEA